MYGGSNMYLDPNITLRLKEVGIKLHFFHLKRKKNGKKRSHSIFLTALTTPLQTVD